ncbi:MAG: UDP-N-acetylmuramoyl-L-alanyl-D-glutamate--2,6-diaminopimelate ligase [Chloroflexi bacterium]|nr:UDP-N-acetylmuramoyl-L-alanyl-D-glutamate--2,6-diaminopimelate ligase [Chloroflexota bacterium]
MLLSQLLAALPAILDRAPSDPDITSIEHDSRQVTPGALFVARRGGTVDGHQFIAQALEKGAVAIVGEAAGQIANLSYVRVPDSAEALAWLCAAFHNFPARKLVMIGVTGTDGKTTTSSLIHSILKAAGLRAGLITTVSAVIGDQLLDTGLHTTTPDAPDVQRYLAQMVEAGMTHCVLETTSHGLAQHRVTACDFDVAVVTNITHEHLDFHGSVEGYRAAKARLFEGLSTAWAKPGTPKLAVLNADDGSFDYLQKRVAVNYVSYGFDARADVRAANVLHKSDGTRFVVELNLPGLEGNYTAIRSTPSFLVETRLVGEYNVSNCLAAIAVGLTMGLPPQTVRRGVISLSGIPGRMERIDLGQDFTAIVDFAHTPNALKRAIEAVRRVSTGRVIVVFGSAGLRDVAKRRWMGEVAAELADFTVITAEDPRTESLDSIMAESAEGATSKGGIEGKTFWRIADRGEAIQFAVNMAGPDDVVIACGKAHEQSMCFGVIEYPWDDRVAMRAALSARLGLRGPAMPRLPTSKQEHP